MARWRIYDEVEHERYGRGHVVRVLHRGLELLVRFSSGLTLKLDQRLLRSAVRRVDAEPPSAGSEVEAPVDEAAEAGSPKRTAPVQPDTPASGTPAVEAPPRSAPPTAREGSPGHGAHDTGADVGAAMSPRGVSRGVARDSEPGTGDAETEVKPRPQVQPREKLRGRVDAVAILEAFRMGIVPRRAIRQWTFGRAKELSLIRSWLADQSEGCLILEGAYGSGKTHLLEYLGHHGLEQNYAVSVLRIDPGQGNAAFPLRLYRELVRGLRVPLGGEPVDLREALVAAAPRFRELPWLETHPLLGDTFHAIERGYMEEDDWAALFGQRRRSERFTFRLDHTTVSNVICNLLSCLGQIFARLLDLNGFLILLDEVETAQTWLYYYHWQRSLNLLRGLMLTANDDPVLLEEDVIRLESGRRVGLRSDLVYSGFYPQIRYLQEIPSFLKVVVAMTPGQFTGEFHRWRESVPGIELDEVPLRARLVLLDQIVRTYRAIHGVGLSRKEIETCREELLEEGLDQSTRRFIKGVVELLDFKRFYPNRPIEEAFEFLADDDEDYDYDDEDHDDDEFEDEDFEGDEFEEFGGLWG